MDKFYHCPECGKKLFRVDENTKVENLYIKCRGCHKEIKVNIKSQESRTK